MLQRELSPLIIVTFSLRQKSVTIWVNVTIWVIVTIWLIGGLHIDVID